MSEEEVAAPEEHVAQYLARVLEGRSADTGAKGAGRVGPGYWADAPWRLEPDQDGIPFTFIVRDGENPPVRMEEISVWEAPDDEQPWQNKKWQRVDRFTEGMGFIKDKFWVYRLPAADSPDLLPRIPLTKFRTICKMDPDGPVPVRGQRLLLKVVFKGQRLGSFQKARYLVVFVASESLPLRQSPQWYYGDTHYHSNYTNDIKEFGNPVPDTRAAGECIGLDWLIVTDHSVDLADDNPYWTDDLQKPDDRWDALGRETQAASDDSFRILRGEEVTVTGQPGIGDDVRHALVFGETFDRIIPGAFAKKGLLGRVTERLGWFSNTLYDHLFGSIYKLEEVLTGVSQSGATVSDLKGRSVYAQGALAFAAHPTSPAQAPGGTWNFYDLMQPIHGMEAWNTRIRHHTGDEECPFDDWREGKGEKAWKGGASEKGIKLWDQILRQKVGLPNSRFVLLAGSDAHGSFNYSEGWWVDWDGLRADDNCLGKVRTLLHLPERDPNGPRQAPTEEEVVEAIREGRCVATDGPVLNLTLSCNGDEVGMGSIMHIRDEGALTVNIQADSTDEFGPVEQVQVICYVQGMDEDEYASKSVDFQGGHSETIINDLPPGAGYVRLETVTRNGKDEFRCFTNPIWFRSVGPGMRQLRVNCIDRVL